jgi:uncharacterized damage-inducible protein DinB
MLDLRYPIGAFQAEVRINPEDRRELLSRIAEAPKRIRDAVEGLSGGQLDTPHRPDGWTVRQVVHHLADAHLNWYVRTKLALTEDKPVIKPYDEARWGDLHEARHGSIEPSLLLLDGLHERWVRLFESLSPVDWSR